MAHIRPLHLAATACTQPTQQQLRTARGRGVRVCWPAAACTRSAARGPAQMQVSGLLQPPLHIPACLEAGPHSLAPTPPIAGPVLWAAHGGGRRAVPALRACPGPAGEWRRGVAAAGSSAPPPSSQFPPMPALPPSKPPCLHHHACRTASWPAPGAAASPASPCQQRRRQRRPTGCTPSLLLLLPRTRLSCRWRSAGGSRGRSARCGVVSGCAALRGTWRCMPRPSRAHRPMPAAPSPGSETGWHEPGGCSARPGSSAAS